MAEAEAVLAGELRLVGSDQLLTHERGQARSHLGLLGCERLDGAAVEDLTLDRAPLEHAPLGRLELVEARREQGLQGGWDDHLAVALAGHRQHLLDEERDAARGASDPLAQLAGDPLRDELVDVFVAQGLEPKRYRPGGMELRELGARHAEQEDRCPRGEQRDVLDQIAERLLAPLDVIEHDHQRPRCRSLLQRLAERPGDLLRRRRRLAFAEQRADRHRGGLVRRQHVELLQHLDHGPVRDPVAVGKAAAADNRGFDRNQKLRHQPRLANTRIADDRQQLTALLRPHTLPNFPDKHELALPSDEPRLAPRLQRVGVHQQQPVGRDRFGLALQLERLERLDLHPVADEYERRLPDQHLARLRRLLQPRSHIHRIAGRQPLLRPRHHLASHHADPPLDSELGQRLAHLHRRPTRPQRVIFVHRRHPKNRHHCVPDELLHAAAVRLDDPLHPPEVTRQQRAQPLRIERLAKGSRAGHIAKQNGHRLALLLRASERNGKREATLLAELRALAVRMPTTRANQHADETRPHPHPRQSRPGPRRAAHPPRSPPACVCRSARRGSLVFCPKMNVNGVIQGRVVTITWPG